MKTAIYLVLFSVCFLYAYASLPEVKNQANDELQAKDHENTEAADFENDADDYDELERDNNGEEEVLDAGWRRRRRRRRRRRHLAYSRRRRAPSSWGRRRRLYHRPRPAVHVRRRRWSWGK
eukprot:Seg1947.1 transcript_id=Seg1947.1/GoldUCD/mRNA.D3Y31 product="hypothetical protein" protein_id=Seg1947.1/GoldUCD/D3Y31